MRTNIVIDEALLESAMQAGPFKTKKDAVEAGLKLLARQAAYREILRWEGKLHWDDGPVALSTGAPPGREAAALSVQEPVANTAARKKVRHGRR